MGKSHTEEGLPIAANRLPLVGCSQQRDQLQIFAADCARGRGASLSRQKSVR